jgi:hypothetical protein
MGAMDPASDIKPEVIESRLEALAAALAERGLIAEPFATRMVWAKNSAADPQDGDPRAAMSPGLRQTVTCRPDDAGRLAWYWVWSGATRNAPSELEYLGPADLIAETADRIARVLRLEGLGLEPTT